MAVTNAFPRLISRQKTLAAYYYLIGNAVKSKTLYNKHLLILAKEFLLSHKYDFVPYKYGAYSFTLENDLRVFEERGLLQNNKALKSYFESLDAEEIQKLLTFFEKYKSIIADKNSIIKYTYEQYPYFAINSEIVSQYPLAMERADSIKSKIHANNELNLFTIGYESRSIEDFFNLLIENNIKSLVDVRCNRFSMKYGFSDKKLSSFCAALGIEYVPFSQLGIISEKRKNLETIDDYKSLFSDYQSTLQYKKTEIARLRDHLYSSQRIALMCFEYDPTMCHRTVLAKQLIRGEVIPLTAL